MKQTLFANAFSVFFPASARYWTSIELSEIEARHAHAICQQQQWIVEAFPVEGAQGEVVKKRKKKSQIEMKIYIYIYLSI